MTCIGCPLGCSLTVEIDGDSIIVTGNNCPNGERYAKAEVSNPTRVVTSTVEVVNGEISRVSCKTSSAIPKAKIFECMEEIHNTSIKAPIKIGDVLIKNVCDTGIDVIATKEVKEKIS